MNFLLPTRRIHFAEDARTTYKVEHALAKLMLIRYNGDDRVSCLVINCLVRGDFQTKEKQH